MKNKRKRVSPMLWMIRPYPEGIDRVQAFIHNGMIAVSWGVPDITGCYTKEEIAKIVATVEDEPSAANLKTDLLNRFSNQLTIGDYVIVPNADVVYTAMVTSDYYYAANTPEYGHQHKVEWLFGGKPISHKDLPEEIQKALNKTRIAFSDIAEFEYTFKEYLNDKKSNEESVFVGKTIEADE